jgi:hypothetical protein
MHSSVNIIASQVWDAAIERQLNFLDESSNSRLLISTRISGLIQGATEVQLSLLSPQESVEMLMHMSEVSTELDASSELVQISSLCGRLPLIIGIAAGMIKSLGSNWRGNVLGMLQEDISAAMAEESDIGLSPADLIVARSIKELDEDTSSLFVLMGIIPEGKKRGLSGVM